MGTSDLKKLSVGQWIGISMFVLFRHVIKFWASIHPSIHHSCLSFSHETVFPFFLLLTSVLFYTYLSRKHQFTVSHVDILWQSCSGFVGMNHQCQTHSQVFATWAIPSVLTQISLAECWELLTSLFPLIAHFLPWPHHHLLNPFTPLVSTLWDGWCSAKPQTNPACLSKISAQSCKRACTLSQILQLRKCNISNFYLTIREFKHRLNSVRCCCLFKTI